MYNVARSREKQLQRKAAIENYELFLTMSGTTAELRQKALLALEALRGEQELMSRATKRQAKREAVAATPVTTAETTPAPLPLAAPKRAPDQRLHEWSLIGGAGALLVGAVFGGVAITKRSSFESTTDAAAKVELRDDARRNAAIGDVLAGVGVATAAVGAALLLFADDERSLSVAPAGGGVSVFGSF